MTLTHALGDIPMVRVLDFMLEHIGLDYTTKEIAEYADVSPSAVKRDFGRLVECSMVTETRKIGRTQLYTLNLVDGVTDALIEFDDALNDYMSDVEETESNDFDARTILGGHNKYPEGEEEWTTGDPDETGDLPPG